MSDCSKYGQTRIKIVFCIAIVSNIIYLTLVFAKTIVFVFLGNLFIVLAVLGLK